MAQSDLGSRERVERFGASSLSAAEAQAIVRRFGYMLHRVHEVVLAELLTKDNGYAERWNDVVKPIAEMLMTFQLTPEGDDAR